MPPAQPLRRTNPASRHGQPKPSIRASQFPTPLPPARSIPPLAERLQALVSTARASASAFDAREAEASRLAAAAGPMASESWVAAQQALSRLVEQRGVTTHVAADIDALASTRLESQHWIQPADREAIAAAAAKVAAINDPQAAAVSRLMDQLAR